MCVCVIEITLVLYVQVNVRCDRRSLYGRLMQLQDAPAGALGCFSSSSLTRLSLCLMSSLLPSDTISLLYCDDDDDDDVALLLLQTITLY